MIVWSQVYNDLIREASERKRRVVLLPNSSFRTVKNAFRKVDKKLEIHHIVPKILGGSNSSENLVPLFHDEHMIAHLLLNLKFCQENRQDDLKKLQFGFDTTIDTAISDIIPWLKSDLQLEINMYERYNIMMPLNGAAKLYSDITHLKHSKSIASILSVLNTGNRRANCEFRLLSR